MDNQISMDVDVLVIGGGAAGLSASMLLSKYGVDFLLVSRHPAPSNLPKAHVIYQKTMEAFNELGAADEVYAQSTPWEQWRYRAWYAGFVGEHPDAGRQIGRIECWHNPGWSEASPFRAANLPQNRLEPILKQQADALSPRPLRFNHEFVSQERVGDRIEVVLRDRSTDTLYTVRTRYLLACDGGRSVGETVGVELKGATGLATVVSMHVTADISQWAPDDDVLLRAIKDPESGIEVMLAPVGPKDWGPRSNEWVWSTTVSPDEHRTLSDDAVLDRMRRVIGLPDIKPQVISVNRWVMEGVVADRLRVGNVFLLGDAAHRHTPTGGLGLNTAVQDAYNLCWKIAAVLQHGAGDALLNTYEEERLPIARRVVKQSLENLFKQQGFNPVLGITADKTPQERWQQLHRLWGDDPADETLRHNFHEFLATLRAEFDSLNITFGYSYPSGAIVAEGHGATAVDDDECSVYRSSTRPGATVPAAELSRYDRSSSIYDLTGHGRFVLLAGENGDEWVAAAKAIAAEHGLPLDAWKIGAANVDWVDWRFEWTRQREITSSGTILVRPDRFVAWRSMEGCPNHDAELRRVLAQLLARDLSGLSQPVPA